MNYMLNLWNGITSLPKFQEMLQELRESLVPESIKNEPWYNMVEVALQFAALIALGAILVRATLAIYDSYKDLLGRLKKRCKKVDPHPPIGGVPQGSTTELYRQYAVARKWYIAQEAKFYSIRQFQFALRCSYDTARSLANGAGEERFTPTQIRQHLRPAVEALSKLPEPTRHLHKKELHRLLRNKPFVTLGELYSVLASENEKTEKALCDLQFQLESARKWLAECAKVLCRY
jgi:hypothetical protein